FPGYLSKLLQNHTAHACDGEQLSLQCPRHSTISIQAALYGQGSWACSPQEPGTRMAEPRACLAPTSLQKVLDECQNLRSCQLLVNSRVFGPDLCPGTTKFLLVSFKCKPTEYKTKSACENHELKLHCQESKFLVIYSATYGRRAHEESGCSAGAEHSPPFDCFSHTALEVLSRRCSGKQRCKVMVSSRDFGSPCLPGVTKSLNVSYACVPKSILSAVNPLAPDNKSSIRQKDGVGLDPKESKGLPKKDGVIVSSNYLATFAYIRGHPERAGLLFMSSVCVGLILTLGVLVIRGSCATDIRNLHRREQRLGPPPAHHSGQQQQQEEEEEEEDSSLSDTQDETEGLYRPSYSGYNSAEAAELAERIERREQIIQEIWMNSGLDVTPPRNINTFY
ncbi:EVA1C protein, partial [Pitta sordida]|nr:EVA1C protein [Pitta sordida]